MHAIQLQIAIVEISSATAKYGITEPDTYSYIGG